MRHVILRISIAIVLCAAAIKLFVKDHAVLSSANDRLVDKPARTSIEMQEKAQNSYPEINSAIDSEEQITHDKFYLAMKTYGSLEFETAISEVLRQQPNHVKALEVYSNYLLQSGRLKLSRDLAERCIAIDPRNLQCHSTKVFSFSRLGDFENSKQEAERCLELLPDASDCLEAMATYHISRGSLDKAEHYIHLMERQHVDKPFTLLTIAMYYEKLGQSQLALSGFQKVCEQIKQPYACQRVKVLTATKI